MLSFRCNFIFVHVPKTAGNSIQTILKEFSEATICNDKVHQDDVERFEIAHAVGAKTLSKHSTADDYRQAAGDAFFSAAFKFAVTRNPFERLVSHYFYRKSSQTGQRDVAFDSSGFEQFVAQVRPIEYWVCLDQPDDKAASLQQCAAMNKFIRFTHLQEDFDDVMTRIGLAAVKLPVYNTGTHGAFPDYYTAKTRELVYARHRREIEAFGYACA